MHVRVASRRGALEGRRGDLRPRAPIAVSLATATTSAMTTATQRRTIPKALTRSPRAPPRARRSPTALTMIGRARCQRGCGVGVTPHAAAVSRCSLLTAERGQWTWQWTNKLYDGQRGNSHFSWLSAKNNSSTRHQKPPGKKRPKWKIRSKLGGSCGKSAPGEVALRAPDPRSVHFIMTASTQ